MSFRSDWQGGRDVPGHGDGLLHHRIHQLHGALVGPGDAFEAESRLAFVRERLLFHLKASQVEPPCREVRRTAAGLRELLDARIHTGVPLNKAATILHAHRTHLIRCFKQTHGLPPHSYLTGIRIDRRAGFCSPAGGPPMSPRRWVSTTRRT